MVSHQRAPLFNLLDQNGKNHSFMDYRGKWVLLYFYSKDDMPGYTTEACGMRDLFPDFSRLNVIVLGVSVDSVESHRKFTDKYHLSFPLLSDEKKEVVKQYWVWGEKNVMGKKVIGTIRTSFIINPDGIIIKIYTHVKPEQHAQEVLMDLESLQ
ncbi:MAG: thioredoxin-dependent thiol peroxidase [Patescibacteria group bacterium]